MYLSHTDKLNEVCCETFSLIRLNYKFDFYFLILLNDMIFMAQRFFVGIYFREVMQCISLQSVTCTNVHLAQDCLSEILFLIPVLSFHWLI